MKTHMIHCNSEFRDIINLPDECVSTKLRVAVNHVCFHLVTQFYTPLYTNVYWALFSNVYYNFSWLWLWLWLLLLSLLLLPQDFRSCMPINFTTLNSTSVLSLVSLTILWKNTRKLSNTSTHSCTVLAILALTMIERDLWLPTLLFCCVSVNLLLFRLFHYKRQG